MRPNVVAFACILIKQAVGWRLIDYKSTESRQRLTARVIK